MESLYVAPTINEMLTLDMGAVGLSFSPDGQTLYAVHGDTQLDIITLPNGTLTSRGLSTNDPILNFIVNLDGSGYFTLHENAVTVWNLNFDQVKRLSPLLLETAADVSISPDGNWVAFSGCRGDANNDCIEPVLELLEVETERQIVFRPEGDSVVSADFLVRQQIGRWDEGVSLWVVTVSSDGETELWDIKNSTRLSPLSSPRMDRVYTTAITGPELVVYGGCLEQTDTGCATGAVEGSSWQSGGIRGQFPDLPGAVTDLIISTIAFSRYRVYALIDGGTVTAIDYDPW